MGTFELARRSHPAAFQRVILYGPNQGELNALARAWAGGFEPGKLSDVPGVVGCKTCEGYTTVDLAACCTQAERVAAGQYVRSLSRTQHATRPCHLVVVYDVHLAAHARTFANLVGVALVCTTCRLHAVPEKLQSESMLVRVPAARRGRDTGRVLDAARGVHPKLRTLARAALAGGPSIPGARKFAHEALKLCLDPGDAYRALSGGGHDLVEEAARLEHLSLGVTRPVHALELLALRAQAGAAP